MKTFPGGARWFRVVIHIAAWIIVFSLPYILRAPYEQQRNRNPDQEGFLYLNLLDIKPQSKSIVDQIAQMLKENPSLGVRAKR